MNSLEPIPRASSAAPSTRPRKRPASRSASRPTRCATASPPTCSSRTSTFASSRSCSAIPSSTTPRSTPAWPLARSGRTVTSPLDRLKLLIGGHRHRQPDPVSRPALEIADIFRRHGAAWRAAHAGHVSLGQLKVMSAIETCRTAALGGHVEACEDCGHRRIAYNSCRNRHCPKCQGAAAREWLAAREADLLPVGYFHVVFTLPAEISDIAPHNKAASTTCCSARRRRPC